MNLTEVFINTHIKIPYKTNRNDIQILNTSKKYNGLNIRIYKIECKNWNSLHLGLAKTKANTLNKECTEKNKHLLIQYGNQAINTEHGFPDFNSITLITYPFVNIRH